MHIDHDHVGGGAHAHEHTHAHTHEHSHDGHTHSHEHTHAHAHDHAHPHDHEHLHDHGTEHTHSHDCSGDCHGCAGGCEHTPMEELVALMKYMVGHNAAHAKELADLAAQLESEGIRPDVVVVDPPRKGLAPEVPAILASMAPKRIVYVSCDPATLARDVKLLGERGYHITKGTAVDMFPRTPHVEAVALIEKS